MYHLLILILMPAIGLRRLVLVGGLSLGIILALLGIANSAALDTYVPGVEELRPFEYTIWRDTLQGGAGQNGRVISLSEREANRVSLMVLRDSLDILPFHQLADKRFHLLVIGQAVPLFAETLSRYAPLTQQVVSSPLHISPAVYREFHPVIVALNQPQVEGTDLQMWLYRLRQQVPVVVVNFGDPNGLLVAQDCPTLVQAPPARRTTQMVAGQLLFGGIATGRPLPESLHPMAAPLGLEELQSISYPRTRLAYADPEYVGIPSDSLVAIEQIVQEGLSQYAMPGCQVLIAKGGYVIYERAFGYHTYRKHRPVRPDDVYDIASITKVAATTLATMRAVDQQNLALDTRLGNYFEDMTYLPQGQIVYDTLQLSHGPAWEDSLLVVGKRPRPGDTLALGDSLYVMARRIPYEGDARASSLADIPLNQLLTHHSGLPAALPIAPYMRRVSSSLFSSVADVQYDVPVAEDFFLNRTYWDSLWNDTKAIRRDSARYRYSCANMILMQRVLDSLYEHPLDNVLDSVFYGPLGMAMTGFNPRNRFPKHRMVPTAQDNWRGQLLCGTVHDPTAALLGGVSGNAGLFSCANDLAILGQMLLNGGEYGGERYVKPETVAQFTARTQGHRALGFDMPPYRADYIVAPSASPQTFGHTGFTGTCFWVDPEHDLIFVFLSNRIHPTPNNERINQLRIRQRIHQVVYDALGVPARIEEIPMPKELPLPAFSVAYAQG